MRESDLRLSDLFVLLLRKWRSIAKVGLVLALCLGIGAVALHVINWTVPALRTQLQADYEMDKEQYLEQLGDLERKIQTNEAQIQIAQSELEELPEKKESYEKDIEDLVVGIEKYKDQIAALEQRLEILKTETADEQKQLELLNVQTSISQSYTDMRQRETELVLLETELLNLPVKEIELTGSIAKYESTIIKQKAELLEMEEPAVPELTLGSELVSFIVFFAVGGIVGILLSAIWILFATIARGKLLSAKQVAGIAALGIWPDGSKKKFLSCVDRWVMRVSSKMKPDAELVCANIVAVSANQKILLCGNAAKSSIDEIAAQLKQKNANIDVICAGSHMRDARAIEGLSACDAVIMVEKLYVSDLETIGDLKERAQSQDKPVLGMVLA